MTKTKTAPEKRKRTPVPPGRRMRLYVSRMRELGHTQVKVWVPASMVDWLHTLAEDARRMHEDGGDPMESLPAQMFRLTRARKAANEGRG